MSSTLRFIVRIRMDENDSKSDTSRKRKLSDSSSIDTMTCEWELRCCPWRLHSEIYRVVSCLVLGCRNEACQIHCIDSGLSNRTVWLKLWFDVTLMGLISHSWAELVMKQSFLSAPMSLPITKKRSRSKSPHSHSDNVFSCQSCYTRHAQPCCWVRWTLRHQQIACLIELNALPEAAFGKISNQTQLNCVNSFCALHRVSIVDFVLSSQLFFYLISENISDYGFVVKQFAINRPRRRLWSNPIRLRNRIALLHHKDKSHPLMSEWKCHSEMRINSIPQVATATYNKTDDEWGERIALSILFICLQISCIVISLFAELATHTLDNRVS